MTGTLQRQLGIWTWSVISLVLEIRNVEITVLTSRIKVFTDHLSKITLTINRRSFMTLGNTKCSQTLA